MKNRSLSQGYVAVGTVILTSKQGFVSFALHITVELGAEGKWQVHRGGDEFFTPTSSRPGPGGLEIFSMQQQLSREIVKILCLKGKIPAHQ